MKIYTIANGMVKEGALVESLTLSGAQIEIPVVKIGEEGRGRLQACIPVVLTPSQRDEWNEKKTTTILYADLGTTRTAKPKLIAKEAERDFNEILCVFLTHIGYRGSNRHLGDKNGTVYQVCLWDIPKDHPDYKRISNEDDLDNMTLERVNEIGLPLEKALPRATYDKFPGKIIATGTIAQGTAGAMGSGDQLIAVMKTGDIWTTLYSGRLYGDPPGHVYHYDGKKIISLTLEEREIADLI